MRPRSTCRGRNTNNCCNCNCNCKLLLSYGNLTVFQTVAVRHLGFLNFWNFNCQYGSEGLYASLCQISWQWSIYCRDTCMAIFRFLIWRSSAILDLLYGLLTKSIWWSLSLWKKLVGVDAVVSTMQLWIFYELGLKMPIHAPKMGVLGVIWPSKWKAIRKGTSLCRNTSYDI